MSTNENHYPPLPEIPDVDDEATKLELQKLNYQAHLDMLKAAYKAQLDKEKAKIDADHAERAATNKSTRDRAKSELDFKQAFEQNLYKTYISVAEGQIDRSMKRAQFVQTAATAITTLYTTVLAFNFTLTKDIQFILPVRGLIPAVLAGLAILFSTAFISFITHRKSASQKNKPNDQKTAVMFNVDNSPAKHEEDINVSPENYREYKRIVDKRLSGDTLVETNPQGSDEDEFTQEINAFVGWSAEPAGKDRLIFLQVSVILLGLSVIFLPVAFVNISNDAAIGLAVLAAVLMWLLVYIDKEGGTGEGTKSSPHTPDPHTPEPPITH